MKKRNHFIAAIIFLLAIIATGCHHSRHRTTTIRVRNHNSTLKIQYAGKIVFNENETAIEYLSPNGFVKYRKDNQTFAVRRQGNGKLTYEIQDGNRWLDYNDAYAKVFVAKVVKEIAEHY